MAAQIPENPNPKSGVVPGSCSFEEMLSAVADFKAPVFEPGGSMQQGMYTPKGETLGVTLPSPLKVVSVILGRNINIPFL